jgi:hypothetical protein
MMDYELTGFLSFRPSGACFMIPIFSISSSNNAYAQDVDDGGNIRNFHAIEHSHYFFEAQTSAGLARKERQEGIFAVRLAGGRLLWGARQNFLKKLQSVDFATEGSPFFNIDAMGLLSEVDKRREAINVARSLFPLGSVWDSWADREKKLGASRSEPPGAGDPLQRLISAEFFRRDFDRAVSILSRALGVKYRIDVPSLEQVHDGWLNDLHEAIRTSAIDENSESFISEVISFLARRLCIAPCVVYEIDDTNAAATGIDRISQMRMLLQKYSAEYTAMQFVRSLHMDIYFGMSNITFLNTTSLSVPFDGVALAEIFDRIKDNPHVAEKYYELLQLPII